MEFGDQWCASGICSGILTFRIFINDLDEEVEGWVSKFADDTKVGGVEDSVEGCQRLQRDIDRMQNWAEKWQMEFNPVKCEVVHFGRSNMMTEYFISGKILGSVEDQRDLGVRVHRTFNTAAQVDSVVKMAFINCGSELRSREVILQLYRTLVRPHLEYCAEFWSPRHRNDVETIERVQRRFTRMLPGLGSIPYENRLSELGLFSLELRRMRGDLIKVCKMMRGIDLVDSQRLSPRAEMAATRGHRFKVLGTRYRGYVRGCMEDQQLPMLQVSPLHDTNVVQGKGINIVQGTHTAWHQCRCRAMCD
ncbi:uncharacterized protein LOC134342681 [Mobula hypostoma]|uniref:uncharacterized protein LOC134342681 n=1 Tax=Mobula hypostoma TaxID=723540 RepID=UPI002FC3255D